MTRTTSLELLAFGIAKFGTGSGLLLRRLALYPTELRAHIFHSDPMASVSNASVIKHW